MNMWSVWSSLQTPIRPHLSRIGSVLWMVGVWGLVAQRSTFELSGRYRDGTGSSYFQSWGLVNRL